MLRNLLALLAIWLVLYATTWLPAAEPQASQATATLSDLELWLAASPHGPGWRSYLQLDELRQAVVRGQAEDLPVVARGVNALSANAPGLDEKPFVAAREALDGWLRQQTNWSLDEMPHRIEEAKDQFRPLTESEIERRRQVVLTAMRDVEQFLARGSRERREGWREFLEWEKLRGEIDKTTAPDARVLRTAMERLNRSEEGLELEPFVALRRALHDYYYGLVVFFNPNAEQQYRQTLDLLKARLEEYRAEPSTERARFFAEALGLLDELSQAPHLVAAIRRHFEQPNFRIAFSRDLLATAIERPVDEPTEVREVILGTDIRGYGRTRGRVRLTLEPSEEHATLVLNLEAQAVTQNVGVNGPATIYSTGTTRIQALHTVLMNEFGIFAGEAIAEACVKTHIYCIAAKHRIVEHIAWRRARESLPQAEAIASGRATARAERQFAQQVREQMKEPNQNFQDKLRTPLLRQQLMPEMLRFSTTTEQLLATARRAAARQLASPTPLPADVGGDVSVRIHESAVGNFAETVVAGKSYTAEDFEELAKQLPAGLAQGAGKVDESDREWSVEFRDAYPVTAEFRDNKATLHVHLARFTTEGRVEEYTMDIHATYTIEMDADGPRLVRDGEVEVDWPDMRRRPAFARRAVYQSKFRQRFEAMLFRKELFVKDQTPPNAPEGFGVLRDFALRSEDGWFTVGMRRIPAN